jgi:hypothetical protein
VGFFAIQTPASPKLIMQTNTIRAIRLKAIDSSFVNKCYALECKKKGRVFN